MSDVRVRFPPSPTGYLHIGGARTAILNWLYARKHHGTLVLRIEDTDAERSTRESIDGILDGLTWLGIDWDEGPYFQTDFIADHIAAAQRLLAQGHAYRCFCSREALEAKREAALAAGREVGYDGTCRHLSAAEVAARQAAGQPSVIRFRVPEREGSLGYEDQVMGRIESRYADVDDFVVVRSSGQPLYLLSNVVDDIRDRITHVIRGQDHLTNTLRQILLYEALGATLPVFAHMPLTLDLAKAKISKRTHGEIVAVQYYRKMGFLPWALVNFLVLLGWSPGDDREIFSREELIEAFTLERILRSHSIFNYRKDDPRFFTDPKAISINAHYLRSLPIDQIGALVEPRLREAGLWDEAFAGQRRAWYLQTLDMLRERFHTLNDFAALGRAWFADDFEIEEQALRKNLLATPQLAQWLPLLGDRLAALPTFDQASVEACARAFAEEIGVKPGVPINGARAAITGLVKGPSMFELLVHLGRDLVVRRLREAGKWF